jgi:hypothetical protein
MDRSEKCSELGVCVMGGSWEGCDTVTWVGVGMGVGIAVWCAVVSHVWVGTVTKVRVVT